jgi:surface protein
VIYTLVHPSTTDAPVHPDQIGVRYHADSTYQFANNNTKNLVAYKETCTTETINNEETTTCNYIAEEGTYMDTTPASMWYTVDSGNHKFYFEDEAELTAYLEQNKDNLMSSTIDLYATKTFARLDIGRNVNAKLKSLAAGTTKTFADEDTLIKAIRMSDALPENFTATTENTISLSTSTHPAYIWFDNTDDNGIIYVYTEAEEILLNEDPSRMLQSFLYLTDIFALANWNTANVINTSFMFIRARSLTDLSALSNWNTASVTNMSFMFDRASSLTNLSGLSNWNTASVTDMSHMFSFASSLTDLSALADWNTGNVTNMSYMFVQATSLTNLSGLANWDTGSVTNMSTMFNANRSLTDISALANWDTSSVTNMSYMFVGISSPNLSGLSNWNTASVTDMSCMFSSASSLTDLSPLASWDTSSVTNMSSMFQGATSLTQAGVDAINAWDITNVGNDNFKYMFRNVPYHPTFTKRQGTWNSEGTFTPSS